MERRVVALAKPVRIGTRIEQEPDHVGMCVPGGVHHRRIMVRIALAVGRRPGAQKQRYRLRMPPERSPDQRTVAVVVAILCVSPGREQQPSHLNLAVARRELQR